MPGKFVLNVEGVVGGKGRPRTRVIFQGAQAFTREEVEAVLQMPGWLDKLRSMFSGRPLATIYPDPDSAKEERLIKGLVFATRRGAALIEGPVELTIEVFLNHPPSWPKWKRLSPMGFFATGKPDVDNLAKLIQDAFNETVYKDDSQISDLVVRRRFTDQPAHIVISVRELVLPARADDLLSGV